jgi:hypothetical protein
MDRFHRYYNLAFVALLGIGETWVLATTDKYWPLSLDDYAGLAVLLWCTLLLQGARRYLGCALAYAVMFGNLYAMLFTRLDPMHGSGERIGALIVLLVFVATGGLMSLYLHNTETRTD